MVIKTKRNALLSLKKWKNEDYPKPFYLTGIKGVGKTYLAYEFAKGFYESYLYISFEQNQTLAEYFNSLEGDAIISALLSHFELQEEVLNSSLLIFDEVYRCPDFLKKYIQLTNTNHNLHTILISSIDVLNAKEKSMVTEYVLFPLQFDEFLTAIGNEWYVEVISAHSEKKRKIPDIVHQELLSTFDEYLWIGGMPDVVNEYLSLESTINITERQELSRIIMLHGIDTAADEKLNFKCRQIFSTVGKQLQKNNQKFQFNLIRKGITYQMYKDALDFSEKNHIVYRMNEFTKEHQFKLFYPDFSFHSSLRNDELTEVERRLRIQNYLFQTFFQKKIPCCFWESQNQASIDFILDTDNCYTAVELKFDTKNKSKSIQSFANICSKDGRKNKGNPKDDSEEKKMANKHIRFSDSNFVECDEYINLPIYSAFCIKK